MRATDREQLRAAAAGNISGGVVRLRSRSRKRRAEGAELLRKGLDQAGLYMAAVLKAVAEGTLTEVK